MRIMELSTARIYGGGEVHLRALCFGLLRLGHEVLVCAHAGAPLIRVLAEDGITAAVLPEKDTPLALARMAVEHRVDLIHAHQSKGAALAVAARYLAGRPRAVLTRHALGAPDGEVPRTGLASLIAVTRAVAGDCLAAGFAPEKVRVVYNGVDLTHFRPDTPAAPCALLGLPPGARVVVIHGRLGKEKGARAALEALLPLLSHLPHYLLVLGEGGERPGLERLVQKTAARARVIFLGHQADVRPFLSLAEIVVAPGPNEAFGLSALEAMAVGRAVVAMAAGGVTEIVSDGRDGLLVPPNNALALAAAVYRLAADADLRRRLGAAARARAHDFSLDGMIGATEAVLAAAARQGRADD